MIRNLTAALLLGCLATSTASLASSVDQDSVPASVPAWPLANSPSPSDLDLDTGFVGGGAFAYGVSLAGGINEWGLRVQKVNRMMPGPVIIPRILTLATHDNLASGASVATRDAVILSTDLDGGSPVWTAVATDMTAIADAIYDPASQRAYFLGTGKLGPNDTDMQVRCVDLTVAGNDCSGWGGSKAWIWFDVGGTKNDAALRLALDPDGTALYVAGYADSASGYLLAHAKLSTSSGTLVTAYGTSGRITRDLGGRASGRDNIVNSVALSPAMAPGGKWLYFAGAYKNAAGDYDGFLMAADPATGNGNHQSIPFATAGQKLDSVTAITVLANGHIAVAGVSETSNANYRALLLGRFEHYYSTSLGAHFLYADTDFCGGGLCAKDLAPPPPPTGNPYAGTRDVTPFAITEWPGNRDLVVVMRGWQNDGSDLSPQPWLSYQIAQQFSASGKVEHAYRRIGFPADVGNDPNAYPAQGVDIYNGRSLLLTGARQWTANNADLTVVKLTANDSIFADQFGGAHGD